MLFRGVERVDCDDDEAEALEVAPVDVAARFDDNDATLLLLLGAGDSNPIIQSCGAVGTNGSNSLMSFLLLFIIIILPALLPLVLGVFEVEKMSSRANGAEVVVADVTEEELIEEEVDDACCCCCFEAIDTT